MKVHNQKRRIPKRPYPVFCVHDALKYVYEKVKMEASQYDCVQNLSIHHVSSEGFPLEVRLYAGFKTIVRIESHTPVDLSGTTHEECEKRISDWLEDIHKQDKDVFMDAFNMLPKAGRIEWWEAEGCLVFEASDKTGTRKVLFCLGYDTKQKNHVKTKVAFLDKGGFDPRLGEPIEITEIRGTKEKKRNRRTLKKCFETHLKEKNEEETESFASLVENWRTELKEKGK